jgi:hypothetical protein
MKNISRKRIAAVALACVAWAFAGCGDDSDNNQEPPQLVLSKAPEPNGDQQTGNVGNTLALPLRVIVTRDGVPAAGVAVIWSTSQGSLNPLSGVTDDGGLATTQWTLGLTVGARSTQASVTDAAGSPVTFTATAVQPSPPGEN